MESRYASTQVLMPVIKELIEEGQTVKLTITGNSMLPLLRHEEDQVELTKFTGNVKKGDMVLIQRSDRDYILHRVNLVDEDKQQFFMVGDAQRMIEGPLDYNQIVAVGVAIFRGDKRISVESPWYTLFVWSWFRVIRFRPRILWGLRKLRIIP